MAGIPCPSCSSLKSAVISVRVSGKRLRRRRECADCSHRYSTTEGVGADKEQTVAITRLTDQVAALAAYHERMGQILTGGKPRTGRNTITWTTEMDRSLKDGLGQGLSQSRIGEQVGVDASVVRRRMKELGLPVNKPWAAKRAARVIERGSAG